MILTDKNFDEEIKKSEKAVLVDFFATWCEPCSILGPIIEKAVEKLSDKVVLAKCNVDELSETAQKFSIDRIPAVILFKGGKPIDSFIGVMTEKAIIEWAEKALGKSENSGPSTDNSKAKEDFVKGSDEYAKKSGFSLNPDTKTVNRIVDGIFENEKKHGKKYCPCRRVTGNVEEDAKKICPCVWHKDEIEKDGHCFCKLFTK